MNGEFDEIRSFRDEDISEVLSRLITEGEVMELMDKLLPGISLEASVQSVKSIFEFQDKLMNPIFINHILPTFDKLTTSGIENIDPDSSYLFISNHRDIVLDSAILNYFLHKNDIRTAEIAIGDNLLKKPWIKDLVRLNKSFIVKRGLENVAMLQASKLLSKYIFDTISKRKESVWIAQRAGRAKDGNDETNRGLINMLYLSSQNGFIDHFVGLRIVPVSISYEFDPCDGRKVRELYFENSGKDYQKADNEDLESMQLGIILPKGQGHIHFGKPLDDRLRQIPGNIRKADIINNISMEIDREIQVNYKLWSSNYIGHSILTGEHAGEKVTEVQRNNFIRRMNLSLSSIEGDEKIIQELYLSMYQQPLLNKRKWKSASANFS